MSLNDYQKLEPGNDIRLIEVDGTAFGMSDVMYFHAYNIPHTPEEIAAAGGDETRLPPKSIWWQGTEYKAWPYQIEGLEKSTDGTSAEPKLSVANLDSSITALCLAYDDLVLARVVIHDTMAKYLDDRNFPSGNPWRTRRRKNARHGTSMAGLARQMRRCSLFYPVRWTYRG
jgi:lambda family phage minor tail protein L